MDKKRIRHFDFQKKPHKPGFLMPVAKGIISFPDLKKRGAVIRKHDMEALEGKPYLLLCNHASLVDLNLMLKATHPYPVNNVMTLEGFNTYTEPIMRNLGVLGKRKFTTDINLIRNIKYCLHELKTVFCLFPETRYSLDGCTSYLPDSLGGLVKM
ncbi:MAG: 1-acyl-sn-glycerol-3-phosphate acyltransferase, partial [Clostridia bacterium]|nr:1-acyl-sn-glycerol-3-phosphate acyltransferase [Clostridia bacterium]